MMERNEGDRTKRGGEKQRKERGKVRGEARRK